MLKNRLSRFPGRRTKTGDKLVGGYKFVKEIFYHRLSFKPNDKNLLVVAQGPKTYFFKNGH
jgi:hypothetical protein